MFRRIFQFYSIVVLVCLLTACGASTASSPTDRAPASGPAQPTLEAAAPDATAPNAALSAGTASAAGAPAASAEASGSTAGVRTFRIVPERTEAQYEVQEQFLSRDLPSKAVGKTNAVEGTFDFSLAGKPTGKVTKITVDLRTLKSDDGRRDRRIREQWLESNTYPFAEFTSTGVEAVPDSYTEGQEISFKLLGNMTIHNTTHPVTFDVRGKLVGDTVTGTATTQLLMKDFGFDAPSIAGMLTVKDGVTVTANFTAKEQ